MEILNYILNLTREILVRNGLDADFATEIASGFFFLILPIFSAYIFYRLVKVARRVARAFQAVQRLNAVEEGLADLEKPEGRWGRRTGRAERRLQRRQISKSIPVFYFGNLKGGVGKTTLTLNFGAYLALRKQKRVLFVDLDFQGSLTAPLYEQAQGISEVELLRKSKTGETLARILTGDWEDADVEQILNACPRLQGEVGGDEHPGNLNGSQFLSCGETVPPIEDGLMARWATRLLDSDVRFQLARFLHHPHVQDSFDAVVLDPPPRQTTAGVNGQCACTHVIVPTRGDGFSLNGALDFVKRFSLEHSRLSPHATMLGFVTTMHAETPPARAIQEAVDGFIHQVDTMTLADPETKGKRALTCHWPPSSQFGVLGHLANRIAFSRDAAQQITYITDGDVRRRDLIPLFDRIFEKVDWEQK